MKRVGIIGTGAIAPAYMKGMATFPDVITPVACADLDMTRATRFAAEYNLQPLTVDQILAADDIDIILNLTIPKAHAAITLKILAAGKHAYSEKPLASNRSDGRAIMEMARANNRKVGCAPDTFLGAGGQTARRLIDDGAIGEPVSANAFMMNHGHESWHPNPSFYYAEGGGPMLDMGPYYLTMLISLLGPIEQIAGMTNRAYDQRVAQHEAIRGQEIPVEIDTHIAGTIRFVSGAVGTIITSFDTWQSRLPHIEIHGTKGSLIVPDPNMFTGEVKLFTPQTGEWQSVEHQHRGDVQRGIGVADMAQTLDSDESHRASGDLALHVLEAMLAFTQSSEAGQFITLENLAQRPSALPPNLPNT